MLWYIEPLMITTDTQQARLTDGLRLHLRHGRLISVLVRIGAAERSYLALDGCPGCAIGRCQPGCHAALLQRLLHSCTATPPLRLVPRGLAQRSYPRVCLAWPTHRAALPPKIDPGWTALRMELHWQPGTFPRLALLLAVGADGPAPAAWLRTQGWDTLSLPQRLARPWLHASPRSIPRARRTQHAPAILQGGVSVQISSDMGKQCVALDLSHEEQTTADETVYAKTEARLRANLRALLAGASPFRRILAAAALAAPEETPTVDDSPFPTGPGSGKSAMRPQDVGAWLAALLEYPQGYTRKTIAALLPEIFKEHALTLLCWLDQAQLLGAPIDPAQPYRAPRPLLLHDLMLLAERLRATPLPESP